MATEKTLRKRENTRARLIEAGARVFTDKGFAGAKIDDVVTTAGFTRGAFYSNYESMESLLRDVVVTYVNALLDDVQRAIDAIEGPPSVDSIVELLESIRPAGRIMYILTTEYTLYRMRNPEAKALDIAERNHISAVLAESVVSMLERMGRKPTVAPQTLSDLVVAFFLDSVACEGRTDQADDPRALLAQVVEAMTMGLSEPV